MARSNRAYISVGKDALKADEILIQVYGGDARQDSILLGAGKRTPLGVSEPQKDKVKETWNTTFKSDVHVVSVKTTTGPTTQFTETAELKIAGRKVVYTLEDSQDGKSFFCKMIPVLRQGERKAGCEQIRIHLADETLSPRACLKGIFTTISNDAGQLGVEYLNVSAREGNVLSCELYFDKPLARFSPKVESCEWN